MQDYRSPLFVLMAFHRMMPVLPDLIGLVDWQKIEAEINTKVDALQCSEDKTGQIKNSMHLMSLLLQYPEANERLHVELLLQRHLMIWTQQQLPPEIRKLTSNSNQVEAAMVMMQWPMQWTPADDVTLHGMALEKSIQLHDDELTKGQSTKLKNLNFNFTEMAQLASGTFMTAYGMIDKPHPLVIAGGILTMIVTFLKAMTISFSEQEASVFWGMIQSQGTDFVSEEVILRETNNMRTEYGLPLLNETQLRRSLQKLTHMECVACRKVGDKFKWRIIENYKIA